MEGKGAARVPAPAKSSAARKVVAYAGGAGAPTVNLEPVPKTLGVGSLVKGVPIKRGKVGRQHLGSLSGNVAGAGKVPHAKGLGSENANT